MQNTVASEVPFLLEEWGKWARQRTGLRLGFRSVSTARNMRGSTVREPFIADTTAAWIDQCVAQVTPERARDAVVLRFVGRASPRRIGTELNCDHRTAARLVDAAMHQVGELLCE